MDSLIAYFAASVAVELVFLALAGQWFWVQREALVISAKAFFQSLLHFLRAPFRFYRGLRSKRDPPPPEIISKVQEAENDAGGAKLHNLYQHYLACQGTWKESTLVISVSKRTRNRAAETFSFITYKYGEELALDLNQRLEEQEKKVEKKTPGKFVRKHPYLETVRMLHVALLHMQ
ncbi:hypothetical protein AK812_SmicGene25568 [Symbiodinium microadriaticum]|uniref:Uncharacterized protein n=1 Tax=Symbiodinium microadriaticum TaxID=2951 RepID=A0A1Q9DBQ5_SYMMI|nr:hypothetical protein AK812_SmicGene25568 [Symbiodinium microadriaticum]